MICSNCGSYLEDNSTFCPHCGTSFQAQQQQQSSQQQPYQQQPYQQQPYQQQPYQQQPYQQQPYQQQPYQQQPYQQQPYQQQPYQQQPYQQQPYQQQPYQQQPYQQQPYQQQPTQSQPPKKSKSGKGLLIGVIAAIVLIIAVVAVLALGKGGKDEAPADKDTTKVTDNANKDTNNTNEGNDSQNTPSSTTENTEEKFEIPTLTGTDVFNGNRFNETIWGYYEEETYDYNGEDEDTAAFRQGMKYVDEPGSNGYVKISALPVTFQAGSYTHFMGPFSYEDELYYAYTELGRANFRKAYMEEVGDLSAEDFERIEKILNLNVMEVTVTDEEGDLRLGRYAYEIKNNKILLYTCEINDDYSIKFSDKPVLEYEFLHEGGKLTLAYKGVKRSYLTDGYSDTDTSLHFAGYASNQNNRYKELEGFYFSQYGNDKNDQLLYVELSNGNSPIDPVLELNKETGEFTLRWEECWVKTSRFDEKRLLPEKISGIIVPVTSYGFTDYTGFFLIIDGNVYKYLMSEEEYQERHRSSLTDDEEISDSELEDLNATKVDILAELEQAFKEKGINVNVDYTTSKITLESNFLFATDSYELSADGKTYLDAFTDVYTSVVLSEKYAAYISRIVVEGHTDTNGMYKYNLTLSQNRADAVAQHCIARNAKITDYIQAVGCSYDYPVYNEDGTVNMAASRRVTFRFVFSGN